MTALKSILNTETDKARVTLHHWLRKETFDRLIWTPGEIFTMIKLESESQAEINLFNSVI